MLGTQQGRFTETATGVDRRGYHWRLAIYSWFEEARGYTSYDLIAEYLVGLRLL